MKRISNEDYLKKKRAGYASDYKGTKNLLVFKPGVGTTFEEVSVYSTKKKRR